MIDRQLMECYVARRDPAAFRDLVARHGPAVLRTCRRLLHDAHEAEDAFQATFLILVRRAPSIRDPDLLGRWLVGVARRVAIRARRRGVRQSERERRWGEMHPTSHEQDWPLLEIRRAVREELGQLPDLYRQPLALCYLEGLTHEEAARRLDCPVGTVKVRLVRARGLLRDRLDRRGIALGVAFLLLLLRRDVRASSVETLVGETTEAMTLAEAGEVATLKARFPRSEALSRVASATGWLSRRGHSVVVALAVAASAMAGLALTLQAQSARGAATAASVRLAELLDAACR